MKLLLDTHIALRAVTDDDRLGAAARGLLLAEDAAAFVSTASLWEIAIKHALTRSNLPVSAGEAAQVFRESGFEILPITAAHVVAVESLPAIHNDPFDRLLVAQALAEPLRLVTHDRTVARYNDTVILV
ncbi:MAG: type II toxin-antitoxin system VapC family toxin [Bifidobacteriaceae bacterium]|nr:type II toxin-antitoxin system VapC family toxin [Bifidobacteriaceae bacterium]